MVKNLRGRSPNVIDKEKYLLGFVVRVGELCSGWVIALAMESPHGSEQRAAPGHPLPPERLIWLLTCCTHNISLKKLLKCHLGLLEGQFVQFTL